MEGCGKVPGNQSLGRSFVNDGNLAMNDYEDVKRTGYLEVVTLSLPLM